jgi:hypothetical protein
LPDWNIFVPTSRFWIIRCPIRFGPPSRKVTDTTQGAVSSCFPITRRAPIPISIPALTYLAQSPEFALLHSNPVPGISLKYQRSRWFWDASRSPSHHGRNQNGHLDRRIQTRVDVSRRGGRRDPQRPRGVWSAGWLKCWDHGAFCCCLARDAVASAGAILNLPREIEASGIGNHRIHRQDFEIANHRHGKPDP